MGVLALDRRRPRRRRRGRPDGRHGLPAGRAPPRRPDGGQPPGPAVLGHARRRRRRAGEGYPARPGPPRGRPDRPDPSTAHHAFWPSSGRIGRSHRRGSSASSGSTIVFCRTRHGADRLAKQLKTLGVGRGADPRRPHAAPARPRPRRLSRPVRRRRSSRPTSPPAASTSTASPPSSTTTRRPTPHLRPPLRPHGPRRRVGRRRLVGRGRHRAGGASLQRHVGIDAAIVPPSSDSLRPDPAPAPAARRPRRQRRAGGRRSAARHGRVLQRPPRLRVHRRRPRHRGVRPQDQRDETIERGQRVEFAVREGRRGLEAVDVVAVCIAQRRRPAKYFL